MSDKVIENNQVSVSGEIVSGFTFSHEVFGEGFYMVDILVRRLSDSADLIPVMISERLIDISRDYVGEYIRIGGQFRSYNRHEEKKNRLVLSVFAREVEFLDEEVENAKTNQICTGRRRWAGRSPICSSRSTAPMGNQITSHASAGAETPALHPASRWEATPRFGAASRAANT